MGKRLFLLVLLALLCMGVSASVVTLRSGKVVRGEILVNNAEVVIVKTVEGARFQYPAGEVESIKDDDSEEVVEENAETEKKKIHGKKTVILLDVGTGGTIIPHTKGGAYAGGEVMIGSRYVGTKQLFLGGGLGVHATITPDQTYTFLPLQVAIKVPFLEGKHSPFVGAAIGCGFALSKKYSHGIFTYAQAGYRYKFNNGSALMVGLKAQFQQTKANVTEIIIADDGSQNEYLTSSGLSLFTIGVNLSFAF